MIRGGVGAWRSASFSASGTPACSGAAPAASPSLPDARPRRPASAAVAARPGRRAAARPAQWERPAGRAGRHSALALPPATSPAAPQRRCSFPVAGSAAGRAWRAHPLAPVISVVASCRPPAATASSLPPLGPSSSLSLLFFFFACLFVWSPPPPSPVLPVAYSPLPNAVTAVGERATRGDLPVAVGWEEGGGRG